MLLFASLAQALGTRRLQVAAEPGDTVESVRDRLVGQFPSLKPFVENLMYAVDEEYARPETPLPDGATLALIPPVSGGQS